MIAEKRNEGLLVKAYPLLLGSVVEAGPLAVDFREFHFSDIGSI